MKKENKLVKCACGCGKERLLYDKRGRKGSYIHGHQNAKNLVNRNFGSLLVMSRLKPEHGHLMWLCLCDCGKIITVSTGNLLHRKQKSCGCVRDRKLSKIMLGDKNPNWKGNDVGYSGVHSWIKRRKPKPLFCECCGNIQPFDLANISNEYKRDVDDFRWVCRKCHMEEDGRLDALANYRRKDSYAAL